MPSLCDKTSLHLLPVGEGGSAVLAVTTTLSYPELWTAEDIAEAELRLLTSVRRSLPQLVASTKTDSDVLGYSSGVSTATVSLAFPAGASGAATHVDVSFDYVLRPRDAGLAVTGAFAPPAAAARAPGSAGAGAGAGSGARAGTEVRAVAEGWGGARSLSSAREELVVTFPPAAAATAEAVTAAAEALLGR